MQCPRKKSHKEWSLQEAQANLSELVEEVLQDGHHTITRDGHSIVIILSQKEFEKYQNPKDTLIDFFYKAPFPEDDLDLIRDKDTGSNSKV